MEARRKAWLVVFVMGACQPTGDDGKPAAEPEDEPAPIDVSELLCAGMEDTDGNEVVPTVSTDGCDGGLVAGNVTPEDGYRIGDGARLELDYRWVNPGEENVHGTMCVSVEVAEDGSFNFGGVAPHNRYSLEYQDNDHGIGYVSIESYSGNEMSVCSDDQHIEALVEFDEEW